jgi:hypothetical protein
MAKARVSLRSDGPRSILVDGRKFEQGNSHLITGAAEIARFKTERSLYLVEDLEDEEPAAPAVVEAVESEETDDEDSDVISDGETLETLSEETMRTMSKKQLVQAAKERGIEGIETTMNKADMIGQIVLAQKE